ncbi:hypothetical protein [Plantactinospora sp. CA-290183]|uniref:hypothetical protein n=1 Tax=Plantactinospora sp. CA-290183 TaxID=3240006 RepID=UPI003D944D9F
MFLALVVTTVATVGLANPAMSASSVQAGEDARPNLVVINGVQSETSMQELQQQAEEAFGKRLPAASGVTAVQPEKNRITSDQIDALAAGEDVTGIKRVGELRNPGPTTTLEDLARTSGMRVARWVCTPVVVNGQLWWYCVPADVVIIVVVIWT